MVKKNSVTVKYTEEELKKIRMAEDFTSIESAALIRMLMREEMKELLKGNSIILNYSLDKKVEKDFVKTQVVRFNDADYSNLCKIFMSVPMTPSYIIKYFIMPRIQNINENKRLVK